MSEEELEKANVDDWTKSVIRYARVNGVSLEEAVWALQDDSEESDVRMKAGISERITKQLSLQEKDNIRTLLKTINRTGTTLLDNGEGTMYLLDHTDREGIENRKRGEEGFSCRLKFSTEGLSWKEIDLIRKQIENGVIRNQGDVNRWIEKHLGKQRRDNSDSIDAQDRRTNGDDALVDSRPLSGESVGGQGNQDSEADFGTGFVRVYNNDGTNGPRYVPVRGRVPQFMTTYHGTPHDIGGRFDHSKMGSGEGAQSHGWGTYVAAREKTSHGYAMKLARPTYKGHPVLREVLLYFGIESSGVPKEFILNDIEGEASLAEGELRVAQSRLDFITAALERLKSGSLSEEWVREEREKRGLVDDNFLDETFDDYFQGVYVPEEADYVALDEEVLKSCAAYLDEVKARAEQRLSLCKNSVDAMRNGRKEDVRTGRHLYTVEIPNNDGTNYIEENKPLGEEGLKRLRERMPKAFKDKTHRGRNPLQMATWDIIDRLTPESTGWDVYDAFVKYTGSKEAASKALNKMGYVGIHYYGRQDGECYVIFNENDAKVKSHVEFMRGPSSTVYGWCSYTYDEDGRVVSRHVVMNEKVLNANTGVHEMGHLWLDLLSEVNPRMYDKGIRLAMKHPLFDVLKRSEEYGGLSDERIANEVLARIIGDSFDLLAEETESRNDREEDPEKLGSVIHRLRKFFKEMFAELKSAFSEGWTDEEIENLTLKDIALMSVKDIISGRTVDEWAAQTVAGNALGAVESLEKFFRYE